MRNPPASYVGWDPYYFVAYSRRDSEEVHKEISWLQDQGYRVAYDEGIRPGSAWSDAIAERIQYCERFIYFLSSQSVNSEHCRRELNFALEEGKNVLAIHLEEAVIPAGIRLSLNNRQAINRFALDDFNYGRKLSEALGTLPPAAPSTDRPTEPAKESNRIHILVGAQPDHENELTSNSVRAVLRYLSWQGGIFRAHSQHSNRHRHIAFSEYQLHISVDAADSETEWAWQLSQLGTGEVIWASRQKSPAEKFHQESDHFSERIAEGCLNAITEFELRTTKGQPLSELSFSQLILKSGQLNYLDKSELSDRTRAIELAGDREPLSGLPPAALASMLSWKLINGLSEDESIDSRHLADAARHALRLDGNDPYVLLNIGTTYCRIGKYNPGLSLIRRAFDMTPTLTARDQLARCLCFAGQPEEAILHFNEILDSTPPGTSFPFVRLAIAQAQAGLLEEASKNALLSTTNYPDDYYGWFVQANLLEQLGHSEEALECIEEGRRLSPKLKLETIIERTAATYGRTPDQRDRLTAGLIRILNAS